MTVYSSQTSGTIAMMNADANSPSATRFLILRLALIA